MPSIDERIVAMSFDNRVFEANVMRTMQTLGKRETTLANVGRHNTGFNEIEKASSRVTLGGASTAIDRLKTRLSGIGHGVTGFSDLEKASEKVTLGGVGTAVDKTQAKLSQLGAGTTFTDIERASDKVSFQGMTSALDSVTAKFSVLQGAASVALGNITSMATMKAGAFAKGFTFGPILDGLHEYETNLKSIQTIQANTDRPLPEIEKSLEELNRYSDQTIYNFSEMAKNIGTFTAAGVDLKTATSSIKGIANMAALSGSNSQQAATAMYQLSQAISSGKVGLQDWNSVVNAGMGGKKLQNALAQTAIAMGDISGESVKLEGPLKKLTINGKSFRESIMAKPGETPWLSSDVLVNTLATLDGRFSKAALAAEKTETGLRKYSDAQIEAMIADSRANLEKKNGVKYTDAQFKSLQQLSTSAFKSATEVKTLGQVFEVAKETIGSGWSASFKNIFGTLGEAKKTFTEMSGTINDFINKGALARNTMLNDWKKLGGRTEGIEAIKQAFQNLFAILKPIGQAFRDLFPAKTGKDLYEMTVRFGELMDRLKPSEKTIDNIRRTFRGVFAVMHSGWTIVKRLIGIFGDLLGAVGPGAGGGFLDLTARIGDFLVKVDKAISEGKSLGEIFELLGGSLKTPYELLKNIGDAIASLFSGEGVDLGNKMAGSLQNVRIELSPLQKIVLKVRDAFNKFKDALSVVGNFLEPIFTKAVEVVSDFGDMLSRAFEEVNYDRAMDALQTALGAGILITLRKAFSGGMNLSFLDGIKDNVLGVLDGLTGSLNAMQNNIKANSILQIATALGVLGAGVYLVSKVDPKRLASSMTAIAIGLGQLVGALHLLGGIGGPSVIGKLAGAAGLPLLAAAMIIMAGALVILAGAVKIFSTMSWEELAKGLTGVGGALMAIKVGMSGMGPAIIPVAAAMIPLALGMVVLAGAVMLFGRMDWESLQKGLLGVVGSLRALAIGLAPLVAMKGLILMGPALIGIGLGLLALSAAVATFGNMDLATLAKGIIGMSIAMKKIAIALAMFPVTLVAQAVALGIVAIALNGFATAIGIMGNLKITTLVKGIVALGYGLRVLAVGLTLMSATLPGAAALLAASVALGILGPALAIIGNLKWTTILKGLAAMGLTLGVLGVAGLIAAPALIALGAGLAALGLGLLGISASIYLVAKGVSLLADTGSKGVTTFIAALTALVIAMPKVVIEFVKGLVQIIAEIAKLAPEVVSAIGVIIGQIAAIIILNAPKVALAAGALIDAILIVIVEKAPAIFDAGMKLLQHFLAGLAKNIGSIVTKVGQIIQRFLDGMTQQAPRIIESGAKLLRAWLNGFTRELPSVMAAAARTVNTFLAGVARHLPSFIHSGGTIIVKFLNGIAGEIPRVVKAGTRVILNFMEGISQQFKPLADKATQVIVRFLRAISQPDNVAKIVSEGFRTVERFIRGITQGLFTSKAVKNMLDAFYDLGKKIASAVVKGLGKVRDEIADRLNPFYSEDELKRQEAASERAMREANLRHTKTLLASYQADGKLTNEEMKKIGAFAGEGMAQGLADKAVEAEMAARKLAKAAKKGAKDELKVKSPSRVFMEIGRNVVEGFSAGLQGLPGQMDKDVVQPLRAMIKIVNDRGAFSKMLDEGFLGGITNIGVKEDLTEAQSKVKEVFQGIEAQILESQQGLKDVIEKDKTKLSDLIGSGKDNDKALKDARKELARQQKELSKAKTQEDYDSIAKEVTAAQKEVDRLIERGNKLDGRIQDAFRVLGNHKELLKATNGATKEMMASLADEQGALLQLAGSYDAVLQRLEEAKAFMQSTTEQFNQLPSFDVGLDEALADMDLTYSERAEKRREREKEAEKRARIDQVANYKKALEEQIKATAKYNETLQALKDLGLDEATYKKLLGEGTKGQDFASQLLAGGKKSIEELNALNAKLQTEAQNLSEEAAKRLFGAGVDVANGIVQGLQSQADAIKAVMNGIAADMVAQIKKQLKIKSPSRVFAQLGAFTTQGFADGLKGSTQNVVAAAAGIGDEATSAMAGSLARISDTLSAEIDSDIKISPVLDLSNVEDGAKKMSGLLGAENVVPITAAASYGQASAISNETAERQAAQAEAAAQAAPLSVTFEQHNMSPDKLSEVEIYRLTNNQLSQLKSVLPGLTA